METLVKQAIKLGNSAGVILPKGWEYKKVRVELVEESITKDVFEVVKEEGLLSDVIGLYLVGSYARGEERPDSDIDALVITETTNKILKKGLYDMFFIARDKLEKNLGKSLYLYSMVKEAKTIINDSLIKEYKKKNPTLPIKAINKAISTVNSMLKINKESVLLIKEKNSEVRDGTAYSVVLRLRELFLINCFLNNREYTNSEFLKAVESNSSREVYEAYLRIKNDLRPKNNLKPRELLNLLKYSEKLIEKIKNGKK